MKTNRYKIVVLSDMKDTMINTIKSGVSLANMIGGDLHFFHVKKPTDVVEKESQLSAMRTINRSYLETGSDIQNILEPISKDYNVSISHSHAFGNVKSEIKDYIKINNPDVIILGKRRPNAISFIGDKITDFVIKNYDGTIMIASEENALEPNAELSLGMLDNLETSLNNEFGISLLSHTQKPVKMFKTENTQSDSNKNNALSSKETVELVFDHGDKSMQSLSNYLTKSDVNLLCLDRGNKGNTNQKSNIKNVINSVNVSLLISKAQN